MTTQEDGQIIAGWAQERCPIINGIFFPDDTVLELEVEGDAAPGEVVQVRLVARTTLSAIQLEDEVDWTYVTQLCECTPEDSSFAVVGGEGGFGGDGFVAVLRSSTRSLVWLAFFDCSNPFVDVSIAKNEVVAVSSYGTRWRFPIGSPERVTTALPSGSTS